MTNFLKVQKIAIGTLQQVRPGPSRPCIDCGRPVYCGDERSQRIANWACLECLVAAVEADPLGDWRFVVPPGMTAQQFVAALRSGQQPHRN